MATADHGFVDLKLSKVNFNGNILEKRDPRAYFHGLCPKTTFFINISNLSKIYLIDFFHSVSNFGPGMVQLKYQRAKRLKFSFLVL